MGLLRALDPVALAGAPLTYAEVGATADAELPAGYRVAEHSVVVGTGRAAFERAAEAVLGWRAQRAAGLRVRATGPAGTPGTVVVLTAGLPRFGYDIPCRVVWASTGGDERGFAYGTLPGHPESGEERFAVRLTASGDVVFTLRVFFRLASPAARLAGPLSLALQRLATARYTAAVRRAAGCS
ncbi:DUF1990 domain-containing protein [Blastococcus sp. MG754426]|uniref:DUF1990 family protein n=1 Tax=unclassified Blastococcus TaxID=2619396 RepID=UPI001EF022D7|nr:MULTISPECIES: DUF1990 domain-containing protein [unclassified Blastococcus]MCF6507345.1 DUF1990 domain-containing protein [Blastococcus sp. MG754426]MCF6511417.1 DUF1990 domain-containing protein [Blastococcus sp. MG754427]MCF6736866.1 DUF1990 domain-containing protein [Blastococcus sp. KM273129]